MSNPTEDSRAECSSKRGMFSAPTYTDTGKSAVWVMWELADMALRKRSYRILSFARLIFTASIPDFTSVNMYFPCIMMTDLDGIVLSSNSFP